MNGKKMFHWSDSKLYLIIVGVLTVLIGIYEPVLGMIAGGLSFFYLLYYSYIQANKKNKEVNKHIETLSNDFESATKHAIFNMPFPLVILDEKGTIRWYNTPFLDMIIEEEILNERIYDLVPNFSLEDLLNTKEGNSLELKYDGKNYLVYPNFVDHRKSSTSKNKIIILYWVDNTDYVDLLEIYKNEQTIVVLAYVDNYDDVKSNTPDINRPMLLAEIDKKSC